MLIYVSFIIQSLDLTVNTLSITWKEKGRKPVCEITIATCLHLFFK